MKNRLSILGVAVVLAFILVTVTIVSAQSFGSSDASKGKFIPPTPSNASRRMLPGSIVTNASSSRSHIPVEGAPGNGEYAAVSEKPDDPHGNPVPLRREAGVPSYPFEGFASARSPSGLPAGLQQVKNALSPNAPDAGNEIYLHVTYSVIEGYVDPDRDLHMILSQGGAQTGEARMRSDAVGFFWADLMDSGWYATVQANDVLTVEIEGGSSITLTVPDITATVFTLTDTVMGRLSGVSLPAELQVNSQGNLFASTTDASGYFTVAMSSKLDVFWDTWVQVGYEDNKGNWVYSYFYPQDGMVVLQTYPAVSGYSNPDTTVLVEVEHDSQSFAQEVKTQWRDGYWQADFSQFDQIDAGDVVTAWIKGSPNTVVLSDLSAGFDLPNDRVIGNSPSDTPVTVYYSARQGLTLQDIFQTVSSDSSGVFTATFSSGNLDTLNQTYVILHESSSADHRIAPHQLLGQVRWPRNSAVGHAQPSADVTVTLQESDATPLEEHTATASSNDGWFQVDFEEPFQSGYKMVFDGGGLDFTLDLVEFTVDEDLDTDTIFGVAPANEREWIESRGGAFGTIYGDYTTASVSGDYQVDLSGIQDLYNGGWSEALYPHGDDPDQAGWQETALNAPFIGLNVRHNGLWGNVPAPNVPITFTLDKGGAQYEAFAGSDGLGAFDWTQFDDGAIDIEPGDVVTVAIDGWSQVITAPDIQISVDTASDQVSGVGPAESFVEVYVYGGYPSLRVPTDASGNFLADFSNMVDIKNGYEVEVGIYDENWNYPHNVATIPYARANTAWDAVDGWFGPDVTVVYTVTDELGVLKGGATGTTRPDGWLEGKWCGELTGDCDMLPGDLVTVTSDDGFEALLEVIPIDGQIDVDTDQISGDMEGASFPAQGDFWCSPGFGSGGYGSRFSVEADGSYLIDLAGEYNLRVGDECEIWYIDPNGNQEGTMLYTLRMIVNYAHDWVEISTTPDDSVEIIVEGKAEMNGTVDAYGWFRTHEHQGDWDPTQPDIETGDAVTVTTGAGYSASVNPVGEIDGVVDVDNDLVTGTLTAPFVDPLMVWCEVWVEDGPPSVQVENVGTSGGQFTCDFSESWNLKAGEDVALIYFQPDGMRVVNVISAPYVRANTVWNAVDGWFGAGVTVQYTVTNQIGDYKGGGGGTARSDGWMDSVNCGCDLLPGDLVTVTSGAGFHAVLQPITITAHLDEIADTVSGQMFDETFPASGYVEDWNHGRQSGDRVSMDIESDGTYTADFSGRIDVLPGDYLNIWYIDPNDNHLGIEYIALRIEAVYSDENAVFVETEPHSVITVTVSSGSGARFDGQADENGKLWTWDQNDDWIPSQPDIQSGDTATVTTSDYMALIDPIGTITGELDLDENTISGTIDVPAWTGSTLQVQCSVWVADGAWINTSADADGGAYLCDFDDVGWDLQPAETVAVYYFETDGDSVVHTFVQNYTIYLPVVKR